MPKFVSLVIDQAHRRYLAFGLWVITFAVVLLAGAALCGQLINQRMTVDAGQMLEPHHRLHKSISSTFTAMKQTATAEPCSSTFHEQLHEIAFLPDGLSEFLFISKGMALCSVTSDFEPYDLGTADHLDSSGAQIWYDRPLDFIGRPGLLGTILAHSGFGIVVPPQPKPTLSTNWTRFELVNITQGGEHWHRAGQAGIYSLASTAGPLAGYLPVHGGAYLSIACVPGGRTCVATSADLTDFVMANWLQLMLGILLSAFLAQGISGQVNALLQRFWSFEARFRRHFNAESVLCTYQPILSLATGKISGCEVLVRWRDVDGAIIYPDQFLPVVERFGLGRQLTQYVVACAYQELSIGVPADQHLQINFNIFPRDLDADWLRDTLQCFELQRPHFGIVVEIVETDQMQIEHAQEHIEALRHLGIETQLDDFGTAYSNIENLARLPVSGVKLDRSFAMAAEGSVMSRMLVNAIDMIHAAGHRVTVEGVETSERLRTLQEMGRVDFVQGYFVSRPLDIRSFVRFLAAHHTPAQLQPRLVA